MKRLIWCICAGLVLSLAGCSTGASENQEELKFLRAANEMVFEQDGKTPAGTDLEGTLWFFGEGVGRYDPPIIAGRVYAGKITMEIPSEGFPLAPLPPQFAAATPSNRQVFWGKSFGLIHKNKYIGDIVYGKFENQAKTTVNYFYSDGGPVTITGEDKLSIHAHDGWNVVTTVQSPEHPDGFLSSKTPLLNDGAWLFLPAAISVSSGSTGSGGTSGGGSGGGGGGGGAGAGYSGSSGGVSNGSNDVPTVTTYTIIFKKNHDLASGSMGDQSGTIDVELQLLPNSFSLFGYVFVGWNTQEDGGGTDYADGDSVTNLTTTPDTSEKLYAQWKPLFTDSVFLDDTDINNYADAESEPIYLAFAVELTDTNWQAILGIVAAINKKVILDLAACTRSTVDVGGGLHFNGDFDPIYNVPTGKAKIVTLILPTAAKSIVAGGMTSTFNNFNMLESITGTGVTNIGQGAFWGSRITSVNFPAVTNIANQAFYDCYTLTSVNFPAVESIGGIAFGACTVLTTVNFPAVQSIGGLAFQNCPALASVTLGASLPTLGTGIFSTNNGGVPPSQVTVHIPASAKEAYGVPGLPGTNFDNSSADDSWGIAFKGRGWNGSTYQGGTVLTGINLVFAAY